MAISIHALREEGDDPERIADDTSETISIHALREEGDLGFSRSYCSLILFLSTPSARRATSARVNVRCVYYIFLSTPSARRATAWNDASSFQPPDFYPRPPRGGRLEGSTSDVTHLRFLSTPSARRATLQLESGIRVDPISIHALREEGDAASCCPGWWCRPKFLSTPSARRATAAAVPAVAYSSISIHALREEGDPTEVKSL